MRSQLAKFALLPFVVALLSCNGGGGTPGECTPGEINCPCNNDQCLNGLECVAGSCVDACIPGELGCECNSGQCLSGLECGGPICTDPTCTPGELYCECNNGLCLGDLTCSGGYCMGAGPNYGAGNVQACEDYIDTLESLPCWDSSIDPMIDCQESYGDLTDCDLSEYFACVAVAYYCDGEFLSADVDAVEACAPLGECG